MLVSIWAFEVKPGSEREFERAYGSEGTWVQLFRRAPGYLDTDLLRDLEAPGRYLTVDRWESSRAYEAFREGFRSEYEALDRRCRTLTSREDPVGLFAPDRT